MTIPVGIDFNDPTDLDDPSGNDVPPDFETLRHLPLEKLIPANPAARFVSEFVDTLDLEALGFVERRRPNHRKPHSVAKLVKLFLFAWFWGIISMRAMAKVFRWDLRFLFLSDGDPPARSTIGRFWLNNFDALLPVFDSLIRRAKEAALVGMDLHALDGTKMRAACSMHTGLHRQGLKKRLTELEAIITKLEEHRSTASVKQQRYTLQQAKMKRQVVLDQLALLDQFESDHLHPQELDARVMKCEVRHVFCYNAQATVDHESDLIVAVGMTTDENDQKQLVPMMEEVKRELGAVAKHSVIDTGYPTGGQLTEAEKKHLPVLGEPQGESDKGLLPKSSFRYDEERDAYICPTGEVLPFEDRRKMSKDAPCETSVYRCHNESCPERAACTSDKKGRTIKRMPFEDAVEHQRALLDQPEMRNLYELRKEIIEHVFGDIKSNYRFRRFTVRGLAKVTAQWVLACIAFNLRKLYKAWTRGIFRLTPELST